MILSNPLMDWSGAISIIIKFIIAIPIYIIVTYPKYLLLPRMSSPILLLMGIGVLLLPLSAKNIMVAIQISKVFSFRNPLLNLKLCCVFPYNFNYR